MEARETCPLQWGDRVDHRVFGFGTVCGEPRASMGFNPRSSRSEFSGWVVPVEWDNKTCSCPGIHHAAKGAKHLQKISSPDAKGAAYWENEWKKLLAPALEARKRTDDFLRKPFRSVERFESQVKEYVHAERSALGFLTRYMCEDDAGRHP